MEKKKRNRKAESVTLQRLGEVRGQIAAIHASTRKSAKKEILGWAVDDLTKCIDELSKR